MTRYRYYTSNLNSLLTFDFMYIGLYYIVLLLYVKYRDKNMGGIII